MQALLPLVVILLLTVFVPRTLPAVEVKPCDKQSGRQCKVLQGVAVDYPAPSWIPDGAAFSAKETIGASVDIRQTAMYLPMGESIKSWTKMLVLIGFDLRNRKIDGGPINHFNIFASQIEVVTKKCGKEHTFFQQISSTEREIKFLVFCEAGLTPGDEAGYDPDHGVVGLHTVFSYSGRVIGVSQEWRGPRFDVRNRASWPVPPGELDLMQARFRTIRVLGSTRPQ